MQAIRDEIKTFGKIKELITTGNKNQEMDVFEKQAAEY